MNKSYKTVWNETTGTYVAAPEVAKSRGKASKSKKILAAAMLILGAGASLDAMASGNGTQIGGCANTDNSGGTPSSSIAIDGASSVYCANATGTSSVAIGASATAGGAGTGTDISGSGAGNWDQTAFGVRTSATARSATAVGSDAAASGVASAALGYKAQASGNSSVSMGDSSAASQQAAVAIGAAANASALNAVAAGRSATASGQNAAALGATASAAGTSAVAIGSGAKATAANSVALGASSTTTANLSAAGYNPGGSTISGTASTANGEVSVGSAGAERRITNVAAGSAATDAVNVSQLMSEDAKVNAEGASTASALGGGSTYNATTGEITNPAYSIGGSTYNNVGSALTNLDGRVANNTDVLNNITNGGGIKYFHTNSTLADSSATGTDAVAIGGNAQATADNSVALGSNSTTTADLTAAAYNPGSTTLAGATPAGEVSVGSAGQERRITNVAAGAAGTDAVNVSQLQSAVTASTANAVAYDDSTHSSVTLGGAGSTTPVKLHNVADGVVAAGSTDAVNGEQLYNVASSTADALGGGASVNSDGTITKPAYDIGGSTYNNVGDALTNLDGRVADNTNAIDNINSEMSNISNGGGIKYFHANSTLPDSVASGVDAVAIGGNAQATANNAVALGANSVADRANTVSVGSAGSERQITNVAAGTADTDAVNVSQLKQAGIIDPTGNVKSAVTYDNNPDGSPNYSSVTLGGGADGTVLHNVANGTINTDAVNVGQLNDALSQVSNDIANSANSFLSVNGNRDAQAASATGTQAAAMGASAVASGNNSTALGSNSQATADNSVALGAGSVADRANSVSVGTVGGERQVTNVAAGTQGTDAVNLNQLNSAASSATSAANGYTDQRFNQAGQAIQALDKSTRQGIAAASALQIVTPYLPGRTTLNAGISTYRGQSAVGVGASRWNDKGTVNYNVGASTSGGNSTILRAGVGIVLGD